MMMADVCKLADDYVNNYQRLLKSSSGYARTKLISRYYSKPLKDLIRRCRAKVGKDRPDALTLYATTKEKMEHYRDKAYSAEEESRSKRYPGNLFHEKVLFTKADQELFTENSDFRAHFLEANLGPVLKAEGKFDMRGLAADPDEFDISIETDHHSSAFKRRTAPEARVRTGLEQELISSHMWELFVKQTMNPKAELASAATSER